MQLVQLSADNIHFVQVFSVNSTVNQDHFSFDVKGMVEFLHEAFCLSHFRIIPLNRNDEIIRKLSEITEIPFMNKIENCP